MAGYQVDREWIREWGLRTRAEQGLPPKVTDPATLAAVADLVRPYFEEKGLIPRPAPVAKSTPSKKEEAA